MRFSALLLIAAAIVAGVLTHGGSDPSRPEPVRQVAAKLAPRGSVAVFNAQGRRAPVTVAVPSGPSTPTRVARAYLEQARPAAARHLVHERTDRLDAGHTVVRFAERHGGVPVIGGEAVVVLDDRRRVVAASSEVLPDEPPSTAPVLSAAQARARALASVARASGRAGLVADGGTLALFDPRLVTARGIGRASLVWDVRVRRQAPAPLARRVLVDARAGAIALEFDAHQAALERRVCDAASTATKVPCTTPVRTEGGAPSAVADVNAAYDYAGDTYAFYTGLGRDGIDGHGMPIISTVRYCPAPSSCPYQNAYWDGKQMVYGAGFAAADDVVGHELTHGVTDYSSQLFYYSQSGAINESLSDIFGEFIDLGNGAGTDTADVRWKVGEDIGSAGGTPIGPLRDMRDPTLFGDPDSTASPNYTADPDETDAGGVHTNSGVSNKTAALMTDGATFNGTTVAGIGTGKAAKVWYAASQILRSGSDFRDLADALDQACGTLVSSAQVTAGDCANVAAATTATQLRSTPATAPTSTAPVCGAGETAVTSFSDDFAAGPSAAWTRTTATGSNGWFWSSESNSVGFDARYSPAGDGNLWGDDPGSRSDSAIAMTTSVTVPATGAHLRMRHAFGFDDDAIRAYDGGVLEYSTTSGSTWVDAGSLMTEGGYTGTIPGSANNPMGSRQAFVRESNGYGVTRLDLSSLAGRQVRFRLRIGSGSSIGDYGWFVDDLRIYRCTVPDTTAPQTTITAAPPALGTDATPTFTFSSPEAGSTFECRIDGGAWVPCTSPRTTDTLPDGEHTFEVRATDASANVDLTPASATFTIDTTPPDTAIDAGPPPLSADATPAVTFSSPEAGATFECRIDLGAWTTCVSPLTTATLVDGQHTFAVRAKDVLGNADASPASVVFTVDATAPDTAVSSGPSGLTSSGSPSFTFTSADGSASFECSLDGAAFAACSSPTAYLALADGAHTFEVRARDAVGNVDGSPALRSFTVDTTAPDTVIDAGPPPLSADATPAVTFSSPEAGATFECRIDLGAWATCVSPLTTATLADGQHAFAVRARDALGNVDTSPAAVVFTIDATAPDTSISSGPSALTNDRSAVLAFASADGSVSFECSLDGGVFAACSSPRAFAALADGPHTFEVRARDAAGNADPSPASRTWVIDATAPDTQIDVAPPALSAGTTPSFAFSADEQGAVFTCRMDDGPWLVCVSPFIAAPALADGPHTFAVRAADVLGTIDPTPATVDFRIETPSTPPGPDPTGGGAPPEPTAGGTPPLPPLPPGPARAAPEPVTAPLATVTAASAFSFTASLPRVSRGPAATRVAVRVRCSAPCRPRLRVRVATRLATALGLRGARVGDQTVVAVSDARRGFHATTRLVATLPPALAGRPLATVLTLSASAEDQAGRRAGAPLWRLRLAPPRG